MDAVYFERCLDLIAKAMRESRRISTNKRIIAINDFVLYIVSRMQQNQLEDIFYDLMVGSKQFHISNTWVTKLICNLLITRRGRSVEWILLEVVRIIILEMRLEAYETQCIQELNLAHTVHNVPGTLADALYQDNFIEECLQAIDYVVGYSEHFKLDHVFN